MNNSNSHFRVIHLVSNKAWGGGERYALDLMRTLAAHGHEVKAAVRAGSAAIEPIRQAGIAVAAMPLRGMADAVSAWRLASLIGRSPCVVHVHNFKDVATAALARVLARNGRAAIVVTRHLARPGKTDVLHTQLYRAADAVVFVSQFALDAFMATNPRVGSGKLTVIHNSILPPSAPVQAASDLRRHLHLSPDRRLIMFHGRLSPEKGVEVLIDALASIGSGQWHLAVVGSGDEHYETALRARVAQSGLSDSVTFLGFRRDVLPLVSQCDFGVLPSVCPEAFGLANLEYMMCGKPHIATSSGAQPEFVRDGIDGLVVEPGNASALAAAVRSLLSNPGLCRQMGADAAAHYAASLTYGSFYEAMLATYSRALGSRL